MQNKIVSREEWLAQRTELVKKEKEFSKLRDELSEQIRALPWVKIDKEYKFQTETGEESLADLFEGRSQLIIYHFMFGPNGSPCRSCSFWADNFNGIIAHINQRDATMIAVSRATLPELLTFRVRMGWSFKWASSNGSDFNFDHNVSALEGQPLEYNYKPPLTMQKDTELPGVSVFYKDENGAVYHTYSRYSRGLEFFNNTYRYLDVIPKGRDEGELDWPQQWVNYRDQY